MKGKKTIVVALVVAALATISIFGAGLVIAQTLGDYPPIIQKIADKFGLNVDDVKAVFDEDQEARHEEMHAQCEASLDEAVEDGKITEPQKQELQTLLDKKKTLHEDTKDLAPEERREAMETHHSEITQWAEDNDVDLKDILGHTPGKGGRHGAGHGAGHGPGRGMMGGHGTGMGI